MGRRISRLSLNYSGHSMLAFRLPMQDFNGNIGIRGRVLLFLVKLVRQHDRPVKGHRQGSVPTSDHHSAEDNLGSREKRSGE